MVPDDRRIRHSAFDQVTTLGRHPRPSDQRDPSSALQDAADHPLVQSAGLVAEWCQPQHIPQALDDSRLASPATADQYVEILAEGDRRAVEKAAAPGDCHQSVSYT